MVSQQGGEILSSQVNHRVVIVGGGFGWLYAARALEDAPAEVVLIDRRIPARTVLWAAGVKANRLGKKLAESCNSSTDKTGRIPVAPDCSLPGRPEVFVIGDMAAFRTPGGGVLPGLAPVAMQQGAYVGRLIANRLRGEESGPFRYVDKGKLATIGRRSAIADFGKLRFGGPLAWLSWLFVHLPLSRRLSEPRPCGAPMGLPLFHLQLEGRHDAR